VELSVGLNTTFKSNDSLIVLKCVLHYSQVSNIQD